MAYTKTTWNSGAAPGISADNLNHIEGGIADAHTTADAATTPAEVDAKITTHETGAKHRWTANKLLKGAGVGADPTEIDVPTGVTIVRKTADETVNNSTTLQNDDHLLVAIGANEVWLVELFLLQQSVGRDSDFKMGWSYPVSCSMFWGLAATTSSVLRSWAGDTVNINSVSIATETSTISVSSINGTRGIRITATIVNGANAGNVNFQWAQDTATAEDTKVLTNSFLMGHKIA